MTGRYLSRRYLPDIRREIFRRGCEIFSVQKNLFERRGHVTIGAHLISQKKSAGIGTVTYRLRA